uniref:SCHIP-1 domain-containing protein n=1 Tax=Steinernema glaseri TaxID=37863 RepID=A0A1I8A1J0_9BILA
MISSGLQKYVKMLSELSPPRSDEKDSNNNEEERTMSSLADVAALLALKEDDSGDDDFGDEEHSEEHSNSSSLESLVESDSALQGDGLRASSTSCSENSFEMSSTHSFVSTLNRNGDSGFEGTSERLSVEEERQSGNTTTTDEEPMPSTSLGFLFERRAKPTASQSMHSFLGRHRNPEKVQKMRESIDEELKSLDTRLPSLDFDKLEKQLASAAFERQMTERKFLGEQVRRRLALQFEASTAGSSPPVHTRPLRSNLAERLQTAMNLQVCYMNELEDESSDSGDEDDRYLADSDSDDLLGAVPKSKSAPNLKSRAETTLTDKFGANALSKASTSKERLELLERETRVMLEKAKEAARMQMELERVLGPPELGPAAPKKLCRMQLSRLPVARLRSMVDDLNARIDGENAALVELLIERDALHMEQDSMLVDIEDLVQHSNNLDSLNLPSFLVAEANAPSATVRILKR